MAGGGIVAFDEGGEVPKYGGKEESVVRSKPGYGRDFDFLPIYVPPKTEPPPALPLASDVGEVFSNIGTSAYNLGKSAIDPVSDFFAKPTSRGSVLRVDPNTGKPVSFGDYMRLQEAEGNAAALPAATSIVENVTSNRPPLADRAAPPALDNAAPRPDTRARPGARQGSGVPRPTAEKPSGMESLLAQRVPELKFSIANIWDKLPCPVIVPVIDAVPIPLCVINLTFDTPTVIVVAIIDTPLLIINLPPATAPPPASFLISATAAFTSIVTIKLFGRTTSPATGGFGAHTVVSDQSPVLTALISAISYQFF
jgi:hypothetical protein